MSIKISNKLLRCNKCNSICLSYKEHHSYKYCYRCKCPNTQCYHDWFICSLHNQRFSSRNMKRMKKHFDNTEHCVTSPSDSEHLCTKTTCFYCDPIPIKTPTMMLSDHSNSLFDFSPNDTWFEHTSSYTDQSITSLNSATSMNNEFISNSNFDQDCSASSLQYWCNALPISNIVEPHSVRYFLDESNHCDKGLNGIVARASLNSLLNCNFASDRESILHMNIFRLCSSITEADQELLASIISDLTSNDIFQVTRPPLDYLDICNIYTKSKFSIFNNIPCPHVFEFENHACVSLVSLVNHMVAFGIDFNSIKIKMSITDDYLAHDILQTKEAKDIAHNINKEYPNIKDNEHLILYVILWSDDFEANQTRKNRNSTWLKTVTICPPKSLQTSSIYTSPIAIGRKGQSHDLVNEMFDKELRTLGKCTLRYSNIYQKHIPVIVKPLIISADRPERSSLNHILGHSGSSSKRWMYSELINRDRLQSCRHCSINRIKRLYHTQCQSIMIFPCLGCCDFNMTDKTTHSRFNPPNNYPTSALFNGPTPPIGRNHVDTDKKSFFLYPIRVNYFHLKTATKFAIWNYIHKVWNKGNIKSYLKLSSVNNSTITQMIDWADQQTFSHPISPMELDTMPLPPIWNGCTRLEQCIDTPMHLLFQGIVKNCIIEIQIYLKHLHLWTTFGKMANTLMDDICSLKCDFCRIEHFNGGDQYSTGGWIAETYLAFGRLFNVILIPILVTLPNDTLAKTEIICLVQSLVAMLSRLMSDENNVDDIEEHIKLFLSLCFKFNNCFYDTQEKCFCDSANFLSLLNLPDQIQQFGSIKMHWEGIHERFIQCVKPHLKNMRSTTSFLTNRLKKMHTNNVMENLISTKNKQAKRKTYKRFRDIKVYKCPSVISSYIQSGKSFIAIITNDNSICLKKHYIVVKTKTQYYLYVYKFIDSDGDHFLNQWFCPIELEPNPEHQFASIDEIQSIIEDYCILIPYVHKDNVMRYTLITKSWKYRNYFGELVFPSVSYSELSLCYNFST